MKATMRKVIAWILVFMLMSADICAIAATLELPNALKIIDEEAFYGATSIDEVVLHDEVTEIRSKAFADSSLTEINLPESIEYIANDAFDGCEDIDVTAEEDTYAYNWAVGMGYITPPATPTPKPTATPTPAPTASPYLKYEIVDNSYVCITEYYGRDKEVFIPSVIRGYPVCVIGSQAFKNISSIRSIKLPDSIKVIDDYAFYNCYNLENFTLYNSNTDVVYDGDCYIGEEAFINCSDLISIDLPTGITSIGEDAFKQCYNLPSIAIPESVTSIGGGAFCACSKLDNILLPKEVTFIGNAAFNGCTTFTSFSIPAGVTSIEDATFLACDNLKNITIPQGVTNIGDHAFEYCENLSSIIIPDRVTDIGKYAFGHCSNLTSIIIPEGVTYIGYGTFEYCTNLKSIYIPATVTIIENTALTLCPNLTIYGEAGSEAERIANKNRYKFIAGIMPDAPAPTPNVISAAFDAESVYLNTSTSATVETDASANVLVMYAENREWGRCAIWTTASCQTEVEGDVRTWHVQYAFNTPGDRTLSFAASIDGGEEGEEKTAAIEVIERPLDITVRDFELSRYIAEPDDTISISGVVNGGGRELQLVTVSLCPDGDTSRGVEIWNCTPNTVEYDLSEIPELVVGETYSGADYVAAKSYNRRMLLDSVNAYDIVLDKSITMEPGINYEVVVDAALTDGTSIEEENISRSIIVRETTVYEGEIATKTSEKGKEFIKLWESCHLTEYDDGQGYSTIGWGHKITSDDVFTNYVTGEDGKRLAVITQEEADALFEKDLLRREDVTNRFIRLTGAKVNQQQYDALSSFFYNGNQIALEADKCMFKLFSENADDLDSIPDWRIYNQLANYYDRKEANTRKGLFKRRLDEACIFTGGEGAYERNNWVIEDWVLNGEPVDDYWYPSELDENVTTENITLSAPEFEYYPEMIYNGTGFDVIWNPVAGANYYNLWYRLDTWDEAKYVMCRNESCYFDFDLGDAKAMWISLYAMADGTHHSPGTTIEMRVSDLGDLAFTGYTLGQTEALDITKASADGYSIGWECSKAVNYQYKILQLSEIPAGDDQSGAAIKTYTGTTKSSGMKIPTEYLTVGKYLKVAVVPIGANGNMGTWRWIGFKVINSKPTLTKPVWKDTVPTKVTSGKNFTISWEPVENAVYYDIWYRFAGTSKTMHKRVEDPECSVKLSVVSAEDKYLHISMEALTSVDNRGPSTGKDILVKGVSGIVDYSDWEYQPGEYFTESKGECTVHKTSMPCKNTFTDGKKVIKLSASQCFGFARYAQYEMYGTHYVLKQDSFSRTGNLSSTSMTEESLKALIAEAGIGAHLRTYPPDGQKYGHSMIVTAITDKGFSIIQCNGRNNDEYSKHEGCRIGTYTYTWSDYINDDYGERGIEYLEYYVG